jgi:GNAT superfamily N-acetyltransferase
MKHRPATLADCALLAELNQQLIQDEGHRHPRTRRELEGRMRNWLLTEYRAVLFLKGRETVAYALFRLEPDEIYLRHLFVVRPRRRQGIGREVMNLLRSKIWPADKRLTVEVLTRNPAGVAFWHAMGYQDYSLKLEIPPSPGASQFL